MQAIEDRIAGIQSSIAAVVGAEQRPVAVTAPGGVSTTGTTPVEPIPVTLAPVAPTSPPINPTGGVGTTPEGPPSPAPPAKQPPSIPAPPVTITQPGGGIGGTGLGMTPEEVSALLAATLAADDSGVAAAIDAGGTAASVQDGWNYFRDAIETIGTDLEGAFSEIGASSFDTGTAITLTEVGAGVTADIAGVDVVGFAGGILVLSWVFGWVIAQLGSMFPDPSLFGWHPFHYIRDGIINFGNQFKQLATDGSKPIIDLFMQPVRQIIGLFQRSANATASAHNKVSRVVQHTIPDAKADAIAQAKLYADQQLAVITDAATQALTMLTPPPTLAQARVIVNEALRHATLVWQFEGMTAAAIISADEYADVLHSQTTTAINDASAKVASDAQTAINKMNSELIAKLAGDETLLASLSTSVDTQLPLEIAQAVATSTAQQTARDAATTQALQTQINALQSQIATLETAIAKDTQLIVTGQSNLLNLQANETVDQATITEQEAIIEKARVDIATNTQTISTLFTQITGISNTLGPVQAAQQLNTVQLAPFETVGAVLLPTALATLSATLNSLKTKVDTCTVDTCDPSSPQNIRNVLRDLLGLMTAAGEIGFIAEAVRDPVAVANTIAPLLDSIDSGALSTLNALLSL